MDFTNAFESLTERMSEFKRSKKSKRSNRFPSSTEESNSLQIRSFREKFNVSFGFLRGTGKLKHKPVLSFDELLAPPYNYPESTVEVLESMQFHSPTPVQSEAIALFQQDLHMLVSAPTGSGKTASYLLPMLHSVVTDNIFPAATSANFRHQVAPFFIILATTQELVTQIWTEAVHLGQHLFPKNGKIVILRKKHYETRKKIAKTVESKCKTVCRKTKKDARELRLPKDTKIIVTTPKRLATLLIQTGDKFPISFKNLRSLVIDECDKMLETNFYNKDPTLKAFRSQLNVILSGIRDRLDQVGTKNKTSTKEAKCLPPNSRQRTFPRVALFSATMPSLVTEWAKHEFAKFCSDTEPIAQLQLGAWNSVVPLVEQQIRYCGSEEGKLMEIRRLLESGLRYPCLIFTESRERANELFKEVLLSGRDILAGVLSGEKTEAQRKVTVRAFREGKLNILICTDLLGRGIDFKGVIQVVNYDVPVSETEYIHRVGRTGRGGLNGYALTLWTNADRSLLPPILGVMKRSGSAVLGELERLLENWIGHKAHQLHTAKTLGSAVVSQRRGERRLIIQALGKKQYKGQSVSFSHQSQRVSRKQCLKQKQLLRRWNPNRQRICDTPSSLTRDAKLAQQD